MIKMVAEKNVAALLAQRKARKRGLNFVEKESKFKSSIKARWRRPRGKHSPMREYHKGRGVRPHPGFGSPAAVRGLVLDGKVPVLVSNVSELEGLDKSKVAVIVSGRVGMRKKMAILRVLSEKGLSVLNVKDAKACVTACEQDLVSRKKARSSRVKKASKAADAKKSESKDAKKAEVKEAKKSETKESSSDASIDALVEKPKKEAEKEVKSESKSTEE